MSTSWILDIIEDHQRGNPLCGACGAPVVPAEHAGAIWQECVVFNEPRTRLRRLLSFGHTRTLLVPADQMAA
jgi:hypothetical protein